MYYFRHVSKDGKIFQIHIFQKSLSKAHEALLGGSERRILRRICGAVQIDGVWRRRYNKKVYSLFNDVDTIKRIKISRLRWAGHVIRLENEEMIKRVMLIKPEGKRRKVDQK
jgi:hypothetical protein